MQHVGMNCEKKWFTHLEWQIIVLAIKRAKCWWFVVLYDINLNFHFYVTPEINNISVAEMFAYLKRFFIILEIVWYKEGNTFALKWQMVLHTVLRKLLVHTFSNIFINILHLNIHKAGYICSITW